MSSPAERFWETVTRWQKDQVQVVLEFFGQIPPTAVRYTGLVVRAFGNSITFRDLETEEERSLSFVGAEIRAHSFEHIESTDAFVVRWENGLESLECVLMAQREFGKPS